MHDQDESGDPLRIIAQARCVILDFDGVIADSEEFQLHIWRELFSEFGLRPVAHSVHSIAGMKDADALWNLCPGLSAPEHEDLLLEKSRRCASRADEVSCVPGIKQALESLHRRKPLFICSSSAAELIRGFLSRHLAGIRFESIVGAGEYPRSKPHPDPYLTTLQRAGVESRHAVAVEDSPTGVQAARAANIRVIHYDRYALELDGVASVNSLLALASDA